MPISHRRPFGSNANKEQAVYDFSPEKEKARQILIDKARSVLKSPRNILTLPGREAHCAKKFRKEFGDDTHIIGVDRNNDIVRFSDLVNDGILDEFYKGDVLGFEVGEPVLGLVNLELCVAREGINKIRYGARSFENKFDFIFLDLTCNLHGYVAESVNLIVENHAAEHCVMGLTFSSPNNVLSQNEIDYINMMAPNFNSFKIHPYRTTCDMVIVVFER